MKFLKLYLPIILWAGLIFYLSSIPKLEATSEPVGNFVSRKFAHLFVYAVLAVLIYRALGWKKALLAVSLSTLYGVTDEIHQYFTPERTFKLTDIIFDGVGSIIGVYIKFKFFK